VLVKVLVKGVATLVNGVATLIKGAAPLSFYDIDHGRRRRMWVGKPLEVFQVPR
jgi:X-X-X-Leu-X-X-Gly heptad repeat protein